MSGTYDSFVFNGNAILIGSHDFDYNKNFFIFGFEFFKLCTEDKSIDFSFNE